MSSTRDLVLAMRSRYPSDAYALMFEVANATGMNHSRWADAVAMGLWPSRGLHLSGFEFKASRSDWIRELKSPAKAEPVYQFCRHWWLVVTDKAIVQDGELPETWGLLVLDRKGKLQPMVKAPALEPRPVTFTFLAALLRSAAKPAVNEDHTALNREYTRGANDATVRSDRERARLEEAINSLQGSVNAFEAAAGFRISDYRHDSKKIGQVVRDVLAGVHDRDESDLKRIRTIAESIIERIDEAKPREVAI